MIPVSRAAAAPRSRLYSAFNRSRRCTRYSLFDPLTDSSSKHDVQRDGTLVSAHRPLSSHRRDVTASRVRAGRDRVRRGDLDVCRIGRGSTNGTRISSQYGTSTANTRVIREDNRHNLSRIPFRVRFTRTEDGSLISRTCISQVEPSQAENCGPQTRDSPD